MNTEPLTSTAVQMQPYISTPEKVPTIGPLVRAFEQGRFTADCGEYTVGVETEHNDTGHGMDYSNQMIVTHNGTTIYDSGMQLWRNGCPGSSDIPENCYGSPGLLMEEDKLLLGFRDGNGLVTISEISDKSFRIRESSNPKEIAHRLEKNATAIVSIETLRAHFMKSLSQKWRTSGIFDYAGGKAVLVFHNGHPTDIVWDYVEVLLFRDEKAYISNQIPTGLKWRCKFQDTTVDKWTVKDATIFLRLCSGGCVDLNFHLVVL